MVRQERRLGHMIPLLFHHPPRHWVMVDLMVVRVEPVGIITGSQASMVVVVVVLIPLSGTRVKNPTREKVVPLIMRRKVTGAILLVLIR